MNVYEAAKIAEKFVIDNTPATTVQTTGVLGIKNEHVLKFASEAAAIRLNGGNGYVFKYTYREGNVTITPVEG